MSDAEYFKSILERLEGLHAREHSLDQEIFDIQREISKITGGTKHTYIFEADGLGLVKIGRASDVQHRLRRLQKTSPVGLRMLRLFPFDCEQLLHKRYAGLRQHGEWFKFCPTMRTVFEPAGSKSNIHRALSVPKPSQPAPSHDEETGEIKDPVPDAPVGGGGTADTPDGPGTSPKPYCRECEGTGIIVYDDGGKIHGQEPCPICRVEENPGDEPAEWHRADVYQMEEVPLPHEIGAVAEPSAAERVASPDDLEILPFLDRRRQKAPA